MLRNRYFVPAVVGVAFATPYLVEGAAKVVTGEAKHPVTNLFAPRARDLGERAVALRRAHTPGIDVGETSDGTSVISFAVSEQDVKGPKVRRGAEMVVNVYLSRDSEGKLDPKTITAFNIQADTGLPNTDPAHPAAAEIDASMNADGRWSAHANELLPGSKYYNKSLNADEAKPALHLGAKATEIANLYDQLMSATQGLPIEKLTKG